MQLESENFIANDSFTVVAVYMTIEEHELELMSSLSRPTLCLIGPCGSRKDTAVPWAEIREGLIALRFAMSAWLR